MPASVTAPAAPTQRSIGFTDLADLYCQQRTKASERTREDDPLIAANPFPKVELPERQDTERPHLEPQRGR